jgi:formiminotetrahydrofolate cyclodeaminase
MPPRRPIEKNLPSMAEFALPGLAALIDALSEDPAAGDVHPAGGTVAAIVAMLAASLAAASADWSRAEWDEAPGARAQAQALRRRAGELAERQTAAYSAARHALDERGGGDRSPADGEADGRGDWRLGVAVERAAEPPLALAATAADIAELSGLIATHGADDIRADAATAALLAAAAARAAARLVEINLVAGARTEIVARARRFADSAAAAAAAAVEGDR